MSDQKISVEDFLSDFRLGFNDKALQQKYRIDRKSLMDTFRVLLDRGLITDLEFYTRSSLTESDFSRAFEDESEGVLKCPNCGERLPPDGLCTTCSHALTTVDVSELDADTIIIKSPHGQYPSMNGVSPLGRAPEERDFISDSHTAEDLRRSLEKAFLKAASKGLVDKVGAALQSGIDVNCAGKYGGTALMRAAFKGHLEIVQMLLDHKADPNIQNKQGNSALMLAVAAGCRSVVETLLKRAADPNLSTTEGDTALLQASASGNIAIVSLLTAYRTDVNAGDINGDTPLMKASEKGALEVALIIVKRGADLNAGNKYGNTALMKAALKGNTEIIKLLLQSGAYVNTTNTYGNTALMKAGYKGRVEIMKLLLNAGADTEIVDLRGFRAIDRVPEAKRQVVEDLFRDTLGEKTN
jgi:ankyrin repeat protein